MGAGLAFGVEGGGEIGGGEDGLAGEALVEVGGLEGGVEGDALVEDEAVAVEVRGAAVGEVFEDAAIELVDVGEAFAFEEGSGFFAADAAGTEGDDGLIFEGSGEAGDGGGEVAEVFDVGGEGVEEGADVEFEIVAGVEEGERAAFIEPGFELLRGDAAGGVLGGVDAGDAEGDDFAFDFDEHAVEGAVGAEALFDGDMFEAGDLSDAGEEGVDVGAFTGDEEVEAFGAEEDGAAEMVEGAELGELGAEVGEVLEGGELVGGDVEDEGHVSNF